MAGLGAGTGTRWGLARRLVAGLAGVGVIYASGVSILALMTGEDWGTAWTLGAAPFVLVDAGKVLLAASGLSAIERLGSLWKSSNDT